MKRVGLAATTVVSVLCALAPAGAAAQVIELGTTKTPVGPPPPCTTPKGKSVAQCPHGTNGTNYNIVLTQITAVATIRDGVTYPTTVQHAGRIVAFTLGLSQLDTNRAAAKADIHFLNGNYGGTTRAQVTILRSNNRHQRKWKVMAQSEVFHVQPYLGQVVQFPLKKSLPVRRGDVVALTTPTWLPILTIQLKPKLFAYRQSRTDNCANPPTFSEAQDVGQIASYQCDYPGTRIEYSATEVTNPHAQHPIHAGDTGK